jgi:alpha-beta hydrolase superfamily lysophospholipase
MEKVTIITEDRVAIIGEFRAGGPHGRAALFLHLMPATKESWRPLATALGARGFSTLAIDLRGHGESVVGADGATLDYKKFSDDEQQATIKDVEAAVRWLAERGCSPARLAIVGASIGANLAMVYAARHSDVPATAALSPGLDYHGVTTADAAVMMSRSQKLLLAASSEDAYAHESCVALAAKKDGAEFQSLDGAGHGTHMLERDQDFFAHLVEWISDNVR